MPNLALKSALSLVGLMPRCYLCGNNCHNNWALCHHCHQELPTLKACCPICALPLDQAGHPCGDCLKNPKPFTACYCSLTYQKPISALIHAFKHKSAWGIGSDLCQHWLNHNSQVVNRIASNANTLVVPVPSHKQQTIKRGYTPTRYLAQQLAQSANLPYGHLLQSHLHQAQKNLNRAQRLRNLTGIFYIDEQHNQVLKPYKGLNIVLVDDVVTSCATAIAASQVLLHAGAASVEVWALARTPAPAKR